MAKPIPKQILSVLTFYPGGLLKRAGEHHIFLLAGGLAFSLFICIIPMVLIVFAALGDFLEKPEIANQVRAFADRLIPYPDLAQNISDLVIERLNEFTAHKNKAGLIGLIGMLIAASGLFSGMRTALNRIFKLQKHASALKGKLRDLGLVMLVLVYFLLSITVLPSLSAIASLAEDVPTLGIIPTAFLKGASLNVISALMIFLSFLTLYLAVPQKRLPQRVIIVSALSAGILWHTAQYLFGYYLSHFMTYERVYGSYALFIGVVIWIYYTALIFIVGAEIGQLYRERSSRRKSSAKKQAGS